MELWYCHRQPLDKLDKLSTADKTRGVFRGALAPAPPLKVKKMTSADVMNIIMAVIGLVGLKRAPECIKMHHFEGENARIFLGRGHTPHPHRRLWRLHSTAFGTRPPQTTFLDTGLGSAPPFHISKYATG